MAKSPAFQFYANDWLSSTQITLMTPAQEGAYIRLLCHAWNDPDCSIPDDDEQLARLSRLGDDWTKGAAIRVRACFEPHPHIPGRMVNRRLLEEREKQAAWSKKSKEGGTKGGTSERGIALRRLRNAIQSSIRKESPIFKDLSLDETLVKCGYTYQQLCACLESKFAPGMTWENYGEWHLDHVVARCRFDLSDPSQFYNCWSLSNLQPLWARENLVKGGQLLDNDSLSKKVNQKLALQSSSSSSKKRYMSNRSSTALSSVSEVFDHWKAALNHPRAILDAKRQRLIRARLDEGFSVDDLKAAIEGCKASPFHQGENDRHQVYDDLTLICRDAGHIESFIARTGNGANGAQGTPARSLSQYEGVAWDNLPEEVKAKFRN